VVPVNTISYEPAGTAVSTVIVTVDVGALVMGLISLGEKLTSIPDGAPVDDRVTVEVKSPTGIRVSVA
jgi:hypothetical protein